MRLATARAHSFSAALALVLWATVVSAATTLDVTDTCGASGASVIIVPVTLTNDGTVNEVSTAVIHLSTAELSLSGVACTGRDLDYTCDANQIGQDVTISATPGTPPISGSSGAFLQLTFDNSGSPCTPAATVTMTVTSATVLDGSNTTIPDVILGDGTFTCECLTTTTSTSEPPESTTTTTTTIPIRDTPDCEEIESGCYHRFEGISIGSESKGVGCENWSEADLCFFVDLNCDYVKQPNERLMCGGGAGSCTDVGGSCTTNADCCTGTCTANLCVLGCGCDLCIRVGNACTFNNDCCTGLCDEGLCVRCLDINNPCTQNQECCTGQCVAGMCANAGGSESTTSTSVPTTTVVTTSSTSSTTSTTVAFEPFALGDCFTAVGLRGDADDIFPWIAPGPETVQTVACRCEGECTSPRATLQLIDGAGNVISTVSTLTCSTLTGDSTFVATDGSDTDRNLVEGERLGFRVTNTPASNDKVTICVTF